MKTKVVHITEENLSEAAREAGELLKNGEVIAIPTETVYGLAAQIYDDDAVRKIFEVKGRPQDNPLIVHISERSMLSALVDEIPAAAETLMDHFWPGPLTIILKKTNCVSDIVTCGLDSVAIRFPVHPVARAIIDATGIPLAAPSANLSGKPSPTSAEHCIHDLDGKVPLIIDGGPCSVGVESTVISFTGKRPTLLRPGIITIEEIRSLIPDAVISPDIFRLIGSDEKVASPGLKHKHYAPDCDVLLIDAAKSDYVDFLLKYHKEGDYAMCFDGDVPDVPISYRTYGDSDSPEELSHNVFAVLRELESLGAKRVLIHAPGATGKNLAVSNRLIRAAGFKVVKI